MYNRNMTFKKIGIVLFLIFSLIPIQKLLAQVTSVGFVPGNIWYSKSPFEEGDKVKIYTFVFNSDSREFSGTVVFFDKTVLLGKKEFTIAGKTANDISIDWTVTAGDHTVFAKIEDAKFLLTNGKYEQIYIAENETEKSLTTVPKKIIPKSDTSFDSNSDTNNISTSVSDITKTIQENTPDFITKPIISSVNSLEAFRENLNTTSNNKKEELKKEIETLNDVDLKIGISKGNLTAKSETSPLLKPFKYVEIFFLSVFSFVLSNKILFYGISAIIIFFLLRFIWKKIF